MNNDLCNMDSIGLELSKQYDNYREYTDLLSQYIMSMITGWQVYITEKDVGIFNFNFVSDISGDSNIVFGIRKEQLCGIEYLMKSVIIPTLNCHDRQYESTSE